jgi:hypothetical protein
MEMIEKKHSRWQARKKRVCGDKIFDNSFNRGDIDFEVFGQVEIDKTYAKDRMESYTNSHDYYRLHNLYETVEIIYNETDWKRIYGNIKKIPKQELCEIYEYIFSRIDDETYTYIEKFISIADYLDVNYKILYDMMPHIYRAKVIQELDEKYNVLKKYKIVKLF